MAKNTDQLLGEVVERLDLILKVLGLQLTTDKSVTEASRLLKMAGLDNITIASILNTSPATIRTLTANLRVKASKSRRG